MNSVEVYILAGGQGRRMGYQDKGLVEYQGKPLVQHVIDRIKPQTNNIRIIANRNIETYQALGYAVISDVESGFHGPLMGMLSAMQNTQSDTLLFVPCDTPNLPDDLIAKLHQTMLAEDAEIVVATDETQKQHAVVALVKTKLKSALQDFLNQGERKVMKWNHSRKLATVTFNSINFANINSLAEI